MIKYYVIDLDNGDLNKAIDSVCEYQNVDKEDITVLKGGIDQAFSVPRKQAHSGIGVVLLSSSYLESTLDVDKFVRIDSLMMRDAFDRLFIVDCEKQFYQVYIGPNTNLSTFTNFDIGSTNHWKIAVELNDYLPSVNPDPVQNHWDELNEFTQDEE